VAEASSFGRGLRCGFFGKRRIDKFLKLELVYSVGNTFLNRSEAGSFGYFTS
jgi:hypothetical protein